MKQIHNRYCVDVGGVTIGGGAPVVVQSMTNTDTADIEATASQIASLHETGSELVRITVNNDAAARAVPGVVDAQPRIVTGVVITADEEIGDEFALVTGATDTYYRERLRGPEHLAAGVWLSGNPKEVVVGRRVAARLGATPPQVVFRFALAMGMVPLTGTRDASHMARDLEVFDVDLAPEEATAIEGLGAR